MTELTPPLVYQAHPLTGEYLGCAHADPDPLKPGKWLIPAMAFTEAPPQPEKGLAVVHVPDGEQVWGLLPDFRGDVYRVSDGRVVVWERFGPLPDDLTAEPCPGPFHVWRDGKWQLDTKAEVEALTTRALVERDRLLGDATTRIAPLQDAVDLGDASSDEEAELTAWKRYRVALNRVQQQAGFPRAIEWPVMPNSVQNTSV